MIALRYVDQKNVIKTYEELILERIAEMEEFNLKKNLISSLFLNSFQNDIFEEVNIDET